MDDWVIHVCITYMTLRRSSRSGARRLKRKHLEDLTAEGKDTHVWIQTSDSWVLILEFPPKSGRASSRSQARGRILKVSHMLVSRSYRQLHSSLGSEVKPDN